MATEQTGFSGDVNAAAEESVELRAAPDGIVEVVVAQAENGDRSEPQFLDPATGKPVSNAQTATPASAVPEIVTADTSNVVRLPAGVSVEKIQVLGANIVLEQPDGSKITILNAALKIPTFVIGDAEIPKETLIAVLEGNGINVAAGPDGTISVASNPSGGGNFSDAGGNIGDAGPAIGLLAPTELQFGALSGEELTLALLDPNDAPLLIADQAGVLTEDVGVVSGSLTISGAIDVSDADVDDTLTVSITPSGQPVWSGGALTQLQIDTLANGFVATSTGWTYQVPNALVQFLNQGETIILSYQVTVTDDDGATSTQTVTVTINGTNDAPVIGVASEISGSVTETGLAVDDATPVTGPLSATGTMVSSDVDNNHTATWSGNAAGTYGSFAITAAGVWTYSLTDASVDNLAEGETRTETFLVTVTDDNGATDTQTVTVTINGTNDAPVLLATQTGSMTEDVNVVGGNLATSGAISVSDVDNNHTLTVTSTPIGQPVWSAGTLTQSQMNVLASGFTASNTGWNYQVTNALIQFLDAGETLTLSYQVLVTDDKGATDNETITVTINGANDGPVAASTCVWLPSDPAQTGLDYANGYPMRASVPTDVDGENVIVTATNAPTGVFYFNGSSYVAVTNGTTLYNPSAGVNLLDDLVYRPTVTVNDAASVTLNLQASDGTVATPYSVVINEVAPNRLPATSVTVGNGKSSLNSGNDYNENITLSQSFVDGISANLSGAVIRVLTDFQKADFESPVPVVERNPNGFGGGSAGSQREEELQVELWIGANKFVVVEADTTSAKFEQSWFFDSASGNMAATVNYSNIFLLNGAGVATSTTLAQFLQSNPASAGDQWALNYRDNAGGSFQGRLAQFEFYYNDPGDPGIVVVGDNTKSNLIYGTSGNDNLTGGALDDSIVGRGGNDAINGGGGNDTLSGGAGNDIIDGGAGADLLDLSEASSGVTFTLVQSATNTSVSLSAVGLGTDTYRNIEGIVGSDHDDILSGSGFADQIYGGAGSDRMTGSGGADTFFIADNEMQLSIDDVITDYDAGQGDAVDLTALLGDLPGGTVLDNNFVRVVQNGNDAALQVDTDGSAGNAAAWQTVAVLENFSVSDDVVKILFNDNGTKTTGEV